MWGRDPRTTDLKLDTKWFDRVFLGKVDLSDENICAAETEADKSRAIRRKPENERWDQKLLMGLKVLPWGRDGGMTE